VLDGFKEIKICTGYYLDTEVINYLPSSEKYQQMIKPIYEVMEGWEGSIVGIRKFEDLPNQAKIYVKRIENLSGCEIILISTSPERSDTIYLKNPFDVN
jgi:adenylosuccinate synthase